MNIEILKRPTEEDWLLCKQCALVTVGRDSIVPPTPRWKHDILKARHSPIRVLNFAFKFELPYWVSVHLCRHVHAQPFVRSQRNDRQAEYDRNNAPQNAPVTMIWYMNAEELMTVANKRLCSQASPETREIVQAICDEVTKDNPEFAGLLVPMCKYGRCNEMYPCKKTEGSEGTLVIT